MGVDHVVNQKLFLTGNHGYHSRSSGRFSVWKGKLVYEWIVERFPARNVLVVSQLCSLKLSVEHRVSLNS